MDYLKEAMQQTNLAIETETLQNEQSKATIAVAYALIAIAGRLDAPESIKKQLAFQDGHLDELAARLGKVESSQRPGYLALEALGREVEDIKCQQTALLDSIGEIEHRIGNRPTIDNYLDRIAAVEQGLNNIGGALEINSVATLAAADIAKAIHGRVKLLEEQITDYGLALSSLEKGAADMWLRLCKLSSDKPRVGRWIRCSLCDGSGLGEENARCPDCDGRGRVVIEGRQPKNDKDSDLGPIVWPEPGNEAQPECWEKLQEAHFQNATLERKLSDITHILHNEELDCVELTSLIVKIITR